MILSRVSSTNQLRFCAQKASYLLLLPSFCLSFCLPFFQRFYWEDKWINIGQALSKFRGINTIQSCSQGTWILVKKAVNQMISMKMNFEHWNMRSEKREFWYLPSRIRRIETEYSSWDITRPEQMVQHSFYACGSFCTSAICWQLPSVLTTSAFQSRPMIKGSTYASTCPFLPKPSSSMGTIAPEFPAVKLSQSCIPAFFPPILFPSFLSQVSELHCSPSLFLPSPSLLSLSQPLLPNRFSYPQFCLQ